MSHQNSAMTAGKSAYRNMISEPAKKSLDTIPSDNQPPGVDEKEDEWEPQSLEEALLGE